MAIFNHLHSTLNKCVTSGNEFFRIYYHQHHSNWNLIFITGYTKLLVHRCNFKMLDWNRLIPGQWPFIHSFIHSGYFYSTSSSPLLLRGAHKYSNGTVSELTRRSATDNCGCRTFPRYLHGGWSGIRTCKTPFARRRMYHWATAPHNGPALIPRNSMLPQLLYQNCLNSMTPTLLLTWLHKTRIEKFTYLRR